MLIWHSGQKLQRIILMNWADQRALVELLIKSHLTPLPLLAWIQRSQNQTSAAG